MRRGETEEKKWNCPIWSAKVLIRLNIDFHVEEVTVVCEFVECFTNFSDALRKYDSNNHVEKRYESSEGEYIYSIHYVVTDESLKG